MCFVCPKSDLVFFYWNHDKISTLYDMIPSGRGEYAT
jgi:hypothetical protein